MSIREEERALATREGGRPPFTQWLQNLKYNFRDEVIKYSLIYRDGQFTLDAANEGAGQAWQFDDLVRRQVTDILFYLNCNAEFRGTFRAEIYRITGTVAGTDGIPVGAALATSDTRTQAGVAADPLVAETWQLCNLHFSTPYVLEPGTSYAFVIILTAVTAGALYVGRDDTNPTAEGNYCFEDGTGWAASTTEASIYYVYENYLGQGIGIPIDITDRWGRQLGQVDIFRYMGAPVGPLNPIDVNVVAIIAANVDVIDRAARLLGIVYGNLAQMQQIANVATDGLNPTNLQTVANFMHVYDSVAMDWNRVTEGIAVGSILTDPSDRWGRQLGLIDLSRVLGGALTAANPVIAGLYGVSGDRVPVYPHDLSIPISPSKITVQAYESLVGATAEGAAANLALSTDHRGAGANSVEFDKIAGNVLAGVSYTIAALDLSNYSEHAQVDFYAYVPTPVGGTLVQAYAALGTDNANLFYWAIPVASLTLDAWNHVHLHMHDVSGVLGVGANLSAITYCAIYVQTNVAGATMANVLVDQLVVKRVFETSVMQSIPLLYDGLTPTELLTVGSFPMIYDPVAGDFNLWRQSTTVGVPLVEGTGVNTNPRRYEKDNGKYSPVVARAGGVATALWTIATTPARTAGQVTTIYTLSIENSTGAAITGWLEIGGVAITIPIHVANNDSVFIILDAGLTSGDADVNCNASVNGVNFSIYVTEA